MYVLGTCEVPEINTKIGYVGSLMDTCLLPVRLWFKVAFI